MIYHPEMDEKPAPRLFHTSHNFRGSYSCNWPEARDAEARGFMRKLRIRPAFGTHPMRGVPGEWSVATVVGEPVFHCLITSNAHRKLIDGDLCALRMLLD